MRRRLLIGVGALMAMGAAAVTYEVLPSTRARSWNERGIALAEAGHHEEAVRAFAVAADLNPGYSAVHYNMGRSYLALLHTDQAATCFRRALDEDPGNVEASRMLTLTSYALRRYR